MIDGYDALEDFRSRLQGKAPAGRRRKAARIFEARYNHLRRFGSSHEDATVGAILFLFGDGLKDLGRVVRQVGIAARDAAHAIQRLLAAENATRS